MFQLGIHYSTDYMYKTGPINISSWKRDDLMRPFPHKEG